MNNCNNCGKPLKQGVEFCTNCGNEIKYANHKTYIKDSRKKSKKGPIICIVIAVVVLIGIFSKDTIMSKYYLLKANKETSVTKSIDYYSKSLKLKYDEEIIPEISEKIKQDEAFDNTLEKLQWILKEEDLNKVYISVYVNKAKDNFNNKNYETVWSYLDKAEQYGYNTAKFEYYDELLKIEEKENSLEASKDSSNFDSSKYYDDYIIPDSNTRYLTEAELSTYSKAELAYIRNEIFARIGYVFEKDKYNDYFRSKSWYVPNVNVKNDYSELNDIEKANVILIGRLESK